MAISRTKDDILNTMNERIPFRKISKQKIPYIKNAMTIYAKQEAIAFAHWLEYNETKGRNTEQLYNIFLQSTK